MTVPLATTRHIQAFLAEHRKNLREGAMMPAKTDKQDFRKRTSKAKK